MAAEAIAMSLSMPNLTIDRLRVSAYRIPTDLPEADGTLRWQSTTLVLVEIRAGGRWGLGFSYADVASAVLIREHLAPLVVGWQVMDIPGAWLAMVAALRNVGRPSVGTMAISAVDVALWDLKARLLEISLVDLLGAVREGAPSYGSGGFTSYSDSQLAAQLGHWAEQGFASVKMKVGSEPERDVDRVRVARRAIGPKVALYVDANGAYRRKQALELAKAFREHAVSWFEEPVSSDDLEGLRLLRDRTPPGMDVAAGEYGFDLVYFRRMLEAGSVDVLQADATRCGGVTGYLQAASLAQAHMLPLSAHTAPSLHLHLACATPLGAPLEYFHDHVRIEALFFDGVILPVNGVLRPDRSRPGLGLEFKRQAAEPFAISV
ncbi:MAG: mandelate racemase [Cyanobacteria bacterium REEB65]|nr:mandelate racemase [Cyanobacteria bacterium REEB65]